MTFSATENKLAVAKLEEEGAHFRALRDACITDEYRISPIAGVKDVSQTYRHCGLLTQDEIAIVDLDATALAERIAQRDYTALQVTRAFARAAAVAQQTTNCLAWFMPDEAIERAQWLDSELDRTGKPVGPLHGVPISVKDFIKTKGIPQSRGTIATAGDVAPDDAHIIAILRAAGAVFMCKTTMPQSVMHLETASFYGVTLNPFNTDLTPGGSSGGEGALIGSRGSPLGIGTDIGGSIRGPAAFCGVWGYKPTATRFPRKGQLGIMPGADGVAGAIGPLARSCRDLELFTSVVLKAQPWLRDVTMTPLPWQDGILKNPTWSGPNNRLRIGVVRDDGVVRPLPPVRKALDALVEALGKREDIELVDFPMSGIADAWTLITQLYYLDGAQNLKKALGDETVLPLTKWITSFCKEQTIHSMWKLCSERDLIRQQWTDRLQELGIDVLLTPAGPGPACPHGTAKYWSYTSIFNLLDWPAATFPTGFSVTAADVVDSTFTPQNASEAEVYGAYDPKESAGAPIGLQLAGPRWEDEKLIAALKSLAQSLPLQ